MRGVPLFSPEGYRLCNRGPAWREHPDYYREDPPEDEFEDFLLSLPEADTLLAEAKGCRDDPALRTAGTS